MKHKNHKKHRARLLTAVFAAVMLLSLLPITVSARENGHTVLDEDYYGLSDSNAAKVPGLIYHCSGHGDKMKPYYVEEENDYLRTVPGIIERIGNKIRYIKGYYCPGCYAQFKSGLPQEGSNHASLKNWSKDDLGIDGTTLADYFQYISEHDGASLADCGFYYPPKDDFEHMPDTGGSSDGGNTYAPPWPDLTDEMILAVEFHSNKALPLPEHKAPDVGDPIGNWDKTGAWTFYQFFYTGMRKIINKPSSVNDPAWDTVRDTTCIYFMNRQQERQLPGLRVNYSYNWYRYDYSKIGDWLITDIMAEYETGELCGIATYIGQGMEIAVPEKVNIPLYGDVKIIGLDIEDHNLTKVYVNDNVTYIRRLSSVNLEEISGCKNLEYIEKYAFQNNVSLCSIPEMPKLDWIAMGAFEGCISLRDIKLPDNMTFIDFTAFGWYDTVLGNYDIGMTDQSWEDFQYLSDLSDNDKILGLTLYAKKGSTTYNLLDTLINKNDALTPALDDSGKPYFKSYGDAVAMMSGEVKEFTSHWNLKSSGDYKGNLASTDKDVDDSTGGRLGEYGEGEPSWKPKDIVKNGAVTGGLLLMLTTTVGIAGYEATKKKKSSDARKDRGNIFDDDYEEDYWGISEVYDDLDRADKTKMYFDLLDVFSKQLKKLGTYGKIGKEIIDGGKKLQKVLDIYAETGDLTLAFSKVQLTDELGEKVVGMATKAVPGIAVWDITTGIFFGNSRTADAVNFGANAEHTVDFVFDMCRAVAGEARKNPTAPKGTKYPGVFGVDEFCKKVTDGAYGENLKNIGLTGDLLLSKGSIGQTWNGIFGEDGMGFMGFVDGICQTATEATTDHSLISGYLLEHFNNKIEQFYENL